LTSGTSKKMGWNFSKLAPHALAEGESTQAGGSMPGQATISQMLRVFPNPNSWKKFLAEYQGIINYPPVI
jgi:hypothetical protein